MAPKKAPRKVTEEESISSSSKEMSPEGARKKGGYRGDLHGLVCDLKSLQLGRHMAMLRKTPFRHLFKAIVDGKLQESICKKSNTTIESIMKGYQSKTTHLRIGATEKIPITEEIIRLIFGIVDGDQRIHCGSKKTVEVDFVKRLFPDLQSKKEKKLQNSGRDEGLNNSIRDYKLNKKRILSSLQEERITSEDFARLAVLYVLVCALAPTRGYNIGWSYTQYLEDINTMTKYNWSMFIFDMLMEGLEKERRGSMGCALILAYSLCEGSRIIDPLPCSPAFPRCIKWDLDKLKTALHGKDIDSFFSKVKPYTKASEEETRLLRIEEDDDVMEVACSSEEEIKRLREKDDEQAMVIEEQKHTIANLKEELKKLKNDLKMLRNKNERIKHAGESHDPVTHEGSLEKTNDPSVCEASKSTPKKRPRESKVQDDPYIGEEPSEELENLKDLEKLIEPDDYMNPNEQQDAENKVIQKNN